MDIIPHGVPDLPLVDAASMKPALGLAGRDVILSFGLLGPGKGYELAIDALPALVAGAPGGLLRHRRRDPSGPARRDGEAYRVSLVERVDRLGMSGHVRFVDRFVSRVELTRWLESADVFVTPYPNMDQIVSGTLSYAMGAGRAIVSTPYTYARELLADGRGVLVPPGSPARSRRRSTRCSAMTTCAPTVGQRAYEHSRRMVWSEVGDEYRRVFARVAGAVTRALRRPRQMVASVV